MARANSDLDRKILNAHLLEMSPHPQQAIARGCTCHTAAQKSLSNVLTGNTTELRQPEKRAEASEAAVRIHPPRILSLRNNKAWLPFNRPLKKALDSAVASTSPLATRPIHSHNRRTVHHHLLRSSSEVLRVNSRRSRTGVVAFLVITARALVQHNLSRTASIPPRPACSATKRPL